MQRVDMKSIRAISILFLLLSFLGQLDGRKGPEDYWKAVMRDQPMPEAIRGRLKGDHQKDGAAAPSAKKTGGHFNRNFDTRPIAIIYHHQDDHKN
ncbi:hypothetical protein Nepgr_004589 [Nepenthes gracilis]|uniref:Uncharacterized protein n=1 Tax=Nepenthes gracilis TaxID=150966 RepID=A0AAD3S1L4_NEPGR|nr:hypothetical protein Nepgr_004589 [Nepenthes gracilis]